MYIICSTQLFVILNASVVHKVFPVLPLQTSPRNWLILTTGNNIGKTKMNQAALSACSSLFSVVQIKNKNWTLPKLPEVLDKKATKTCCYTDRELGRKTFSYSEFNHHLFLFSSLLNCPTFSCLNKSPDFWAYCLFIIYKWIRFIELSPAGPTLSLESTQAPHPACEPYQMKLRSLREAQTSSFKRTLI